MPAAANPWDVPPVEPVGDLSKSEIYEAVGKALSEWEGVEASCARLFGFLVGSPGTWVDLSPAIRAFGVVVSFPSRCEMVNAAAEAFVLVHPEVKQYEKYISDALLEAKHYSARRNEIAHGTVREVFNHANESEGFYLTPHLYNPKKFPVSRIPTFQFVSKNILFFTGRFSVVGQKIAAILQFLEKEPLTTPARP